MPWEDCSIRSSKAIFLEAGSEISFEVTCEMKELLSLTESLIGEHCSKQEQVHVKTTGAAYFSVFVSLHCHKDG